MPPAPELRDFAERYTDDWCSQDAALVASFFSLDGLLQVNDGESAVGQAAIAKVAQGFMDTFPDLHVRMDELSVSGESTLYFWTLTGTAAHGRRVSVSGVERWTIGADHLIARSLGQFDSADYERQMAS